MDAALTDHHVIANQSADWCGNPFSFCIMFDKKHRKGMRIATPVCALARNDTEDFTQLHQFVLHQYTIIFTPKE